MMYSYTVWQERTTEILMIAGNTTVLYGLDATVSGHVVFVCNFLLKLGGGGLTN